MTINKLNMLLLNITNMMMIYQTIDLYSGYNLKKIHMSGNISLKTVNFRFF